LRRSAQKKVPGAEKKKGGTTSRCREKGGKGKEKKKKSLQKKSRKQGKRSKIILRGGKNVWPSLNENRQKRTALLR